MLDVMKLVGTCTAGAMPIAMGDIKIDRFSKILALQVSRLALSEPQHA